MSRKTVSIEHVKERANFFLATSEDEFSEQRRGLAGLMESILFDTGNYKGFSYLPSEYLPAEEQTSDNVLRPGYDPTRRVYH